MSDRLRIERDTDDLLAPLTAEEHDAALLDDLLRLLPVETARPAVRAHLARDPEAAAKVAGAWVREEAQSRRARIGLTGANAGHVWQQAGGGWLASHVGSCGFMDGKAPVGFLGPFPTPAEAEAAVDALLAAEGWVLGRGEEVERG